MVGPGWLRVRFLELRVLRFTACDVSARHSDSEAHASRDFRKPLNADFLIAPGLWV